MMDAGRHPRIELHTLSEVAGLSGRAGAFKALVRKTPRYVDGELCVACGLCTEACPQVRPNEYDIGLKTAKAIDRPFPQAIPAAYHIDHDTCLNDHIMYCDRCVKVCEPDAINFDQQPEEIELDVGSVIVATGFDELDPRELLAFGYGRSENVLTGMEFERLLCATGPTSGHVLRPTDHKPPKKIVFVQCVGSRGEGGNEHCSRYCCLNTVKSAMLAHEHEPTLAESVILATDLRAAGRGYDAFVERGQAKDEISMVRGRPAKIVENKETGDLTVHVEDFTTGRPMQIEAGMVVLSTAALPSQGSANLAKALKIDVDERGFLQRPARDISPEMSSSPGVYIAGSAGAPAVIPECVSQGSAAAVAAGSHVLEHRETVSIGENAEPIDSTGPPRIGVFVCHCGANIAGVVDVTQLRDEAAKLPGVVFATDEHFACADISQRAIEAAIREHKLNRIVAAACTPRTHEPVFREVLARTGLNPFLFEMVNIRDQCTWVHASDPEGARLRARDQLRMGIARAANLKPLTPTVVDVTRRIVVVGGGVAGLRAALDLDRQKYEVHLVERGTELGGMLTPPGLKHLYGSGADSEEILGTLKAQIKKSSVTVHCETVIGSVGGYVGNFTIELRSTRKGVPAEPLMAGAILLATGAKVFDPTGLYGYGEKPNVISSLDLELKLGNVGDEMFGEEGQAPKTAVFIQCVGSRCKDDGCNPGCSRFCCPATVKQAAALAKRGTAVTVFYRDMRMVSGGAESQYREARGAGVLFVRVPDDHRPEVLGKQSATGVVAKDLMLGLEIEAPADLVVLAVGMVPDEESIAGIKEILKTPVGPDGFFMERHPELGPVETVVDGVFVCGTAVGAKPIADALAEASAAAGKAGRLLCRQALELEPTVAQVDTIKCRGCGACVEICEFNAPALEPGEFGVSVAKVNKATCKGCGTCVAWCPSGAMTACHFTEEQIDAMMETMLQWEGQ